MTNPILLLVVAVVLTFLAGFFPLENPSPDDASVKQRIKEISSGAYLAGLLAILFLAATKIWPNTFHDGVNLAMAAVFGIVVSLFSASADRRFSSFPIGMAVVGGALVHLSGASTGEGHLAYIVGTLVGAIATSGGRPKMHGAYLAVLAAAAIGAADFLGHRADGSEAASVTGLVLGLSSLIASIVAGLQRTGKSDVLQGLSSLLVLILVGGLACWRFLGSLDLAAIWVGSVVTGAVVHFVFEGEGDPTPFRFVLCTVIWIAAATVAFGVKLGYGMSISILGGVAALTILRSVRGLMSMGVAISILVYRFFRELQPEGAKALDIGQHYSMVGLAIGALMPLLPIEWSRGRGAWTGGRSAGIWMLWLLILLGVPVAASILLGAKGAVGIVVGFSFASVIEGTRGTASLETVGIATGLGALTTLSYGWLTPLMNLGREEKTRALLIVAVLAAAVGAGIFVLGKKMIGEEK